MLFGMLTSVWKGGSLWRNVCVFWSRGLLSCCFLMILCNGQMESTTGNEWDWTRSAQRKDEQIRRLVMTQVRRLKKKMHLREENGTLATIWVCKLVCSLWSNECENVLKFFQWYQPTSICTYLFLLIAECPINVKKFLAQTEVQAPLQYT